MQLTKIFNIFFCTGVFPSELEIARVIAIHIKESKLICSNYWSRFLLSNLDKILEKLMYNDVYDSLEKHKLIYSLQFGFRHHNSTSYALLNLTESIMKALDEKNFAFYWFVDLQKDTIDHIILFEKLDHYGVMVCYFIKKETLAQALSCEFCEISKNTFFTEHLQTTASMVQIIFNRSEAVCFDQ